jgi:hypothetical protein
MKKAPSPRQVLRGRVRNGGRDQAAGSGGARGGQVPAARPGDSRGRLAQALVPRTAAVLPNQVGDLIRI